MSAARIPEADLERVKRGADLAALVRARGVALARHGARDLLGKCPFHADGESPNFIVSPQKGLFHCMACGVAGNAIQFVQRFDGISFRHAFELLERGGTAAWVPPPGAEPGRALKSSSVARLECPLDAEADDRTLLNQVVAYYHERLLGSAPALEYLERRGLREEGVLRRLRLGFADRSLGLRLPDKNRVAGAVLRRRLTGLGLWRESGHEHFNGCIVVPILDAAGLVAEIYGRRVSADQSGVRHLYLPGPHGGIFNREAALAGPEVILCEAVLDALTFIVNGLENVTAIFGTEGFTDELFGALTRGGVRTVRLAYDADEAGERAAGRDAERLRAAGLEVFRIKFPWGMDANEYARKVTPAAKSLRLLLGGAQWLAKGKAPPPAGPVGAAPVEGNGQVPVAAAPVEGSGQVPVGAAPVEGNGQVPVAAAPVEGSGQVPVGAAPVEGNGQVPVAASNGPGAVVAGSLPEVPVFPVRAAASSSLAALELAAEAAARSEAAKEKTGAAGESELSERDGRHVLTVADRTYRVSGLEKNLALDVLKITLRVQWRERLHADALDLWRDGERRRFVERAAEETGLAPELLKRDLGRLLLALEQHQERQRQAGRAAAAAAPGVAPLTPAEEAEALAWLRAPDLLARLGEAFAQCGIVGEDNNKLTAYLACVSRLLDKPLAVIIQSTSAAGKTALMEAVLAFFPASEQIKYSAMTGQSLYYLGGTNLRHKILAIVEEEGAEKASYALKLLQSEGELTIASTGKDPHTGRMVTQEYRVEGPVTIFLTTTAIDIDEELQNRCLTLSVDESREQTEKIHALQRQRRTLAGLRAREERREARRVLRNAQRLLAPVAILNPFAPALTFESERTRTRRDHEKYLTLIDSLALLHQHQRPRGRQVVHGREVEYIEATLEDIAVANRLAPEILGRSLDELPPQTRRLYGQVRALVRALMAERQAPAGRCLFSRRQLRERSGWSLTQVRVHLERLVELEYLAPRHGRTGSSFLYELLVDPEAPEQTASIGLLDVAALRAAQGYAANLAGERPRLAGQNGHLTAPDEKTPSGAKPASISLGCVPQAA